MQSQKSAHVNEPLPDTPVTDPEKEALINNIRDTLVSARAFIVALCICIVGLGAMIATLIIPSLKDYPSSLATQLIQQIGIAFLVTGILSILAERLVNTTKNRLEQQVTKFLTIDVTKNLNNIQANILSQTGDLKQEVKSELDNIKKGIDEQTSRFIYTSASLQAMDSAGISRIYEKRKDAVQDILKDLRDPEVTHVQLIGISFNDFVRDSGVFHEIWKLIMDYVYGKGIPQNKQLNIQVLMIDPRCHGAYLRSSGEHRTSNSAAVKKRLIQDVDITSNNFSELEEEAEKRKQLNSLVSFSYRLYPTAPILFLIRTNVASYVQSYYFWKSREPDVSMPLIRYNRLSPLHNGMKDHFEWIWDHSSVSSIDYYKEHSLGVDRGLHQSGAINVFDDPQEAKRRIIALMQKTEKVLYIQGFSLRAYSNADDSLYKELRRIVREGKVDVRILLINPESEQAIYRSYREFWLENPDNTLSLEEFTTQKHKNGQLFRDTERTISQFRRIAPLNSPKFHVKLYNTAPYFFLLMTDTSVVVEQYHYGKIELDEENKVLGRDMARFEYTAFPQDLHDLDKPLQTYQLLRTHFDFVFNHCSEELR